jgi:hypothetical protein
MNPTMAVASLGGGLYGGAIEYFMFDGDFHGTGYLIGSMVGGLGAGIQQGFKAAIRTGCDASTTTKLLAGVRSVAPETLGGAIAGGAAYYHTGDLRTAVGAAGLGMMGGSFLRAVPGVRRFADPTRGVCFAPGTPVRTLDGHTSVESVVAGDLVLSRRDDDPNAPVEAKVVEEVFVRIGVLWRLVIGGREIQCTAEHPFYVENRGWTPCHELQIGDRLATDCLDEYVTVSSVEETGIESEVYNFRVADYQTYFVGEQSWGLAVWAHNTGCGPKAVQDAAGNWNGEKRLTYNQAKYAAKLFKEGKVTQAEQYLSKIDGVGPATIAKLKEKFAREVGKVHELEYVHRLKKGKVTDRPELEQQIQQTQITQPLPAEAGRFQENRGYGLKSYAHDLVT